MNYGDFSSLVQLGVGLHVGTAILQLYGEFGTEPLVRCMSRIKAAMPEETHSNFQDYEEEYSKLASDYEIFKIKLFQQYRSFLGINSLVALALTVLLAILAFKAQDPMVGNWDMMTIPIVALSTLPALGTLGVLWFEGSSYVTRLKTRADSLEERVLTRS